jgi:gentisate 1,2-dioxygenase
MTAKSLEKWLTTLKPGDRLQFERGRTTATLDRTAGGVQVHAPGFAVPHHASCESAAELLCDGKGQWSPVEMRLKSL